MVIRPRTGWASLELGELWRYRELLYLPHLARRQGPLQAGRARRGLGGPQPLLTMVVFTVVFGRLLGVQSPGVTGVPYAVFSYAACCRGSSSPGRSQRSAVSLVGNANLITKVYFPRLVIPIAAVLAGLVDFAIALRRAAGPDGRSIGMALTVEMCCGCRSSCCWPSPRRWPFGLWLSALNVLYRDVQYVIPFLIQLWMFLTPVDLPDRAGARGPAAQLLYGLNPMAGVIEGFRWALLGGERPGDY